MKKSVVVLFLLVVLLTAFSSVAYVAPGGMPDAHRVDGRRFGGLVAYLAQAFPQCLVSHVGCQLPFCVSCPSP